MYHTSNLLNYNQYLLFTKLLEETQAFCLQQENQEVEQNKVLFFNILIGFSISLYMIPTINVNNY